MNDPRFSLFGASAACAAPRSCRKVTTGKPAGVRCLHLDDAMRCRLFGRPERPAFCAGLRPSREMCGDDRDGAIAWLARLERLTSP